MASEGSPKPDKTWIHHAGTRSGAFVLAVLCGIGVPLSPIGAEWFVTAGVEPVSWFAVGVTYVAGVGLVSKSQTILIVALLSASALAFVYGVDMKGLYDAAHMASPAPLRPLDPDLAKWAIGFATLLYLVERGSRHLVVGKPFL
jgi:hypothetical protein